MIYENIELTRQVATAHWGWTIAFFLWFVGLGGMTLVLNAFAKSRHLFFAATARSMRFSSGSSISEAGCSSASASSPSPAS